jgi:hypothetical protein
MRIGAPGSMTFLTGSPSCLYLLDELCTLIYTQDTLDRIFIKMCSRKAYAILFEEFDFGEDLPFFNL